MSYILDALKKSDLERQQGTSPNLHSEHGSTPLGIESSPFKQHRAFWLIPGGLLLFFACLGIIFFQYQKHLSNKDSTKATDTPTLSAGQQTPKSTNLLQSSDQITPENRTPHPQIHIKEKFQTLQSAVTETFDRPVPARENSQESLPLLKELPSTLQAEIPNLKLAGHTYAENPYQRMIIINGKILREGDRIDGNTRLREINWEGVTIEFKGTRFRVKIN